jgi:phenylalanyl-tRNA synthetase beta chain
MRRNQAMGWLGLLHPEVQKRIDKKRTAVVFALQLDALAQARVPAFRSFSKFPSIRRDLSFFVDDKVSAEALTKAARAEAGDILRQVVVFDVYRGKGVDSRQKKRGFRLDFAGLIPHAY